MGGEDTDKIIRIPGESLLVSLSQEETNYRKKYLPDPAKLTDEKLVCTVCSASLAQNIHKGKNIFVHRALHVLLCEACYNFYGDGCFSVDEDGDDKYCRWCGQGGTLYLCSTCTCAFCQKCVKQNLKPNVLADLENDDWKCYICNPRPLYGCRTICWGAEELNKIGKEKEKEKLKKQRERLEKIEEEKKKNEEARKSSKSFSEEAVLTKKRTRNKDSDTSSHLEVMPTKRTKRESKSGAGDKQNGSVSKSRRHKDDSSSDDMSEEDKRSSRTSRRKVSRSKKSADSSSDEYEVKRKSRSKQKKQKESDDSSEEDRKRSRRRSVKKKADSSEDDTDDEKPVKRKRLRARKKPSSDSSSDEKEKSKTKKKKKYSTDEDSDDDKKRKKASKKKDSDEESDNSTKKSKKTLKNKNNTKNKSEAQDSDNEPKKVKKTTDTDDELKPKLNPKDLAENAMIKKRIKLAIMWLNNTVKDIAELGGLISLRATKFCKKKINLESLKSYEDVINTVGKLKQLINGIHSNYDHIEKTLDGHLKPWKILTGIEDQENEKHPDADISNVVDEGSSKPNLVSQSEHEGVDKSENDNLDTKISNGKVENKVQQEDNVNLHWSGSSANESDTEENNATRALISKADETLNRDEEDNNKNTKGVGGKDQSDEINHPDKEEASEVPDKQISKNLVENEATEEKSKKKNSDESQDDEETKVSKDDDSNNESDEELPTKKKTSLSNSSPYKKGKEKSQEENVVSEKNKSTLSSSNSPKNKGKRRSRGHASCLTEESCQENNSELKKFSKEIKEKWAKDKDTRKMNLKNVPGLDSSDDNDSRSEAVDNQNGKRDLKTTIEKNNKSSNKAKKSKLDLGESSEITKKEKKGLSSREDEDMAADDNEERGVKQENNSKLNEAIKPKNQKATLTSSDDESDSSLLGENKKSKSKEAAINNVDLEGIKEDMYSKDKNNTLKSEDEEEETGIEEFNESIETEIIHEDISIIKEDKESVMDVDDANVAQEVTIEDSSLNNYESTSSKTKLVSLDSSDDEAENKKTKKNVKTKEKRLKKKSERNQKLIKSHSLLESSDDDSDDNKPSKDDDEKSTQSEDNEKEDPKVDSPSAVLLSSSDASDSDVKVKKRKKKGSSDSDFTSGSGEDSRKTKKKRKLIRCKDSSEESGGSDKEGDISKKSATGESPGKGGRKNIKKIKGKGDLEDATLEAAEEEKERRKRIEERQKLFNQIFEIKEVKKLDKLVLDFDPIDKKELISVHKDLVEKMKPHQAKGVKFMWDSCFESVKRLKKEKGSGCILAHCMGLGKTFQVISLVHTLLTHEETGVHTVMVVCPLSTVLNWYNEFGKWLDGVEGGDDIEVFHLTKCKQNPERARELRRWQLNGGVLIIGYEMFRNLTCETTKKFKAKMKKDFKETLIDPGADLIVCDEGHMLKNEATALSKAMTKVKTLRRVVLTGTPLQNNLKEYHCMVQFVKPNLLGTRKEFLNRFVNPITNGQFVDSTDKDVKIMKRRAHVLHKMLEGLVQRFDYNVLTPFLPPKHEYVISVCLSELQVKLYQYYLENFSQKSDGTKAGSRLFMDWQALGRVWTHPRVLKMSTDKENLLREKRALEASDSEGSLKDFIDDGSDADTSPEESSDDNSSNGSIKSGGAGKRKVTRSGRVTRATRASAKNYAHLESSDEEKEKGTMEEEEVDDGVTKGAWWSDMVEPKQLDDIMLSGKLTLLFAILKECEMIEDKVLVFSQSLYSLDLIEYFLSKIDEATQAGRVEESLGNHQGSWSKGLDYFRLDGSTTSENRNLWCKAFNRPDNERARLFLISTRAGGLGINLTAANRVIIFDASWNPSHDIQSIFRIYRFGQTKPCYVYRFIAHGTMEEKVYDRQVAKQSLSNRVVDEQQVHRHFSMNDLNELYTFTPPSKKEDRPTPILPKDPLMAEILTQFSDWIEKYHEHDSLLENVVEEELNEEERKLAWEDYENDKKGLLPPPTNTGGMVNNSVMSYQIEYLRQALKAKYPTKSDEELNQMLIYQVSLLMKQQQMFQNQASGSVPRPPPMYANRNMTQEQLYNLQQHQMQMQYMQQQMQMKQAMQNPTILPKQPPLNFQKQLLMQQQANLARLQMQRMQQKPQIDPQSYLQNLLSQPSMQVTPAAAQLQKMKESYDASRLNKPLTITEITDDKPNV